MLIDLVDSIKGKLEGGNEKVKIKATVVLMKKNVLDLSDFEASILDNIYELVGKHVSFELVSATVPDPNDTMKGKVGEPAHLENWISSPTSVAVGESTFAVTFNWEEEQGVPGAVLVKNNHHSEFYLKSLTLENFPGKGRIHFACNSWVYPVKYYNYDRLTMCGLSLSLSLI